MKVSLRSYCEVFVGLYCTETRVLCLRIGNLTEFVFLVCWGLGALDVLQFGGSAGGMTGI